MRLRRAAVQPTSGPNQQTDRRAQPSDPAARARPGAVEPHSRDRANPVRTLGRPDADRGRGRPYRPFLSRPHGMPRRSGLKAYGPDGSARGFFSSVSGLKSGINPCVAGFKTEAESRGAALVPRIGFALGPDLFSALEI